MMTDSTSDGSDAEAPAGTSSWVRYGVLAATGALVIGVFAYTARSGFLASTSLDPGNEYYNLLVKGFQVRQLNLKTEVPPALAQAADPYDPSVHSRYPVLDMSYYKGKLYLYFGVTPAVVLFWPYAALTGQYLLQKDAGLIFCAVGFLASVWLLCAAWRRYFAEVHVGVVAAGVLGLGLATGTPILLARCDVYEVTIGCGYALTMLALVWIWRALHDSSQRGRWLAAASLAYGLAVGARPSLLFGAVVVLVPVVQAWRERGKVWVALLGATGPMTVIGLGLMAYNWLRFDNPFEFGWHYQLAGDRQVTRQLFSVRYLWINFRVYFLEWTPWSGRFPFVREIAVPALPAGHGVVEQTFGVLTNIPLVWMALGCCSRCGEARSSLRWFLVTAALLFGSCTLTICLFFAACIRYEVEFLPPLVLLAVIGILSVESVFASQPIRRGWMRWGWSLLLGFSVAFSLFASVERCAEACFNSGRALQVMGQLPGAMRQYEQALRIRPDYGEAHNNLGTALLEQGKVPEAIGHFEQALRLEPDDADIHYDLGVALQRVGQTLEAMGHYDQALRIRPDFVEAHNNLGAALMGQGRLPEAIDHFEQALRLKPNDAGAHYNLGKALFQSGKVPEAIGHFEQALRLKPGFTAAQDDLARARAVQ